MVVLKNLAKQLADCRCRAGAREEASWGDTFFVDMGSPQCPFVKEIMSHPQLAWAKKINARDF